MWKKKLPKGASKAIWTNRLRSCTYIFVIFFLYHQIRSTFCLNTRTHRFLAIISYDLCGWKRAPKCCCLPAFEHRRRYVFVRRCRRRYTATDHGSSFLVGVNLISVNFKSFWSLWSISLFRILCVSYKYLVFYTLIVYIFRKDDLGLDYLLHCKISWMWN